MKTFFGVTTGLLAGFMGGIFCTAVVSTLDPTRHLVNIFEWGWDHYHGCDPIKS